MIDFITDIVHQTLVKITCSRAAIVYHCNISIDSIFGFQTLLPTEIRKMVAWPLGRDSFTCSTNIHEVSLKFPSCLIVVLTMNFGVHHSICSD